MAAAYHDDLAYVHHVGFGDFARGAAPGLLGLLREAGIHDGLVVDLGCGSGIWAGELVQAGYSALGIDTSPAMVALARTVAPAARFVQASLYDADFPACDAVTAIGEPLSYVPAEMETPPPLSGLFGRVARALRPAGLFLFDVIVPSPGRLMNTRSWRAGDDWAVLVHASEEPERRLLTREITTFRRVGEAYRRSHETHRVRVYDRAEIERELREAGFSARACRRYGECELLPGRLAFRARKRAPG
jgi:SAM-dependent methyltransferase